MDRAPKSLRLSRPPFAEISIIRPYRGCNPGRKPPGSRRGGLHVRVKLCSRRNTKTTRQHIDAAKLQVEVYRLGWYDGDGGRLVACLPNCTGGSFAGTNKGIPAPDPVTLEVRANWWVSQQFIVDGNTAGGVDKNLNVDAIVVSGVTYESEAPTTYSVGSYSSDNGCGGGNKQSETLHRSNSYFQYVPSPSGTSIQILAAGDTGTEQMQLQVDGVTVKTWNNIGGDANQRIFQSFSYTHPTAISLSQVRVAFTNDGNTAGGADRNLSVDALVFNGQRFETEAPATDSTGTYDAATGCPPGN